MRCVCVLAWMMQVKRGARASIAAVSSFESSSDPTIATKLINPMGGGVGGTLCFTVVGECLLDLGLRVHHKWSVFGDRFVDRPALRPCATEQTTGIA